MTNSYNAADLEADNLHAWDGSGTLPNKPATSTAERPSVLVRATFKNPDAIGYALGHAQPTPEQAAALEKWVHWGEYVTVELLSDGTARVVPAAEL